MGNIITKYSTLVLLVAAMAYFVIVPTIAAASVVVVLGLVRGVEVLFHAKTNAELEQAIVGCLASQSDLDQLVRDRINRFIAVYNMPLAAMGTAVDTTKILGDE